MPATAYVVAAPRRCDAVSATLRAAYSQARNDNEGFADLIAQLDGIAPTQSRR